MLNFFYLFTGCGEGGENKNKPQVVKRLIQGQDVTQLVANSHPRLFRGHQADIQILWAKREGLSNPTTGNVVAPHGSWQPAPRCWYLTGDLGDVRHQCHPTCFHHRHTVGRGGVTSMCASGTHFSPPALPQVSVTGSHHLGICTYFWRGSGLTQGHTTQSTHSWLVIHSTEIYWMPILGQALF